MNIPCEIIVMDVLPRMRALLARELISRGYSQVKTAGLMGITQPAVSQYLKKARSRRVAALETDEMKVRIKRMADDIIKNKNPSLEICSLCKQMKQSGSICEIHHRKEKVPSGCKMCFSGDKA